MSTLTKLRDLRRRLAESDKLRSTLDHAADVAALDALLAAADSMREAQDALVADGGLESQRRLYRAARALTGILRGES